MRILLKLIKFLGAVAAILLMSLVLALKVFGLDNHHGFIPEEVLFAILAIIGLLAVWATLRLRSAKSKQ
jgi:Na+/melibiose symporter-like transporter